MNKQRGSYVVACVIATGAVFAYLAWRPKMLRWGATEEEAADALPGDERTPHPRVQSTRAITIDAPPDKVWAWIVQMGMGRAGFYTHEWVERPLGGYYAEGHSATRIHPEFQDLKVGDVVDYGGGNHVRVDEVEPYNHLVHAEAFVLRALPGDRTRLIVRTRGMGYISPAVGNLAPDAPLPSRAAAFVLTRVPGVGLLARGLDLFVSDPLHHYMEIGMLKGIKERAEGQLVAARGGWPTMGAAPVDQTLRGWRQASLAAIKTVHTIAFFSIGSCLAYFAFSALTRRSDRRAAIAGAVVTGETLVYALNGFRCPLTDLAERLGSEHGSVADIYLPRWIEAHLPEITGPIFAGAVMLHARNILNSRALARSRLRR